MLIVACHCISKGDSVFLTKPLCTIIILHGGTREDPQLKQCQDLYLKGFIELPLNSKTLSIVLDGCWSGSQVRLELIKTLTK